jgi:hypothetical protein
MQGRSNCPDSWLDDLERHAAARSILAAFACVGHAAIDTNDIPMIRSGNSTRFTPNEVEEFRQVGLDLVDVKCQNDIEQEVSRWAYTLADERFDLLEKIAWAMAKAKGVKLPPRLSVVPSAESTR